MLYAGIDIHKAVLQVVVLDPGRASARRGRRRQPKTDRLDARWLALLLARELLSECEAWLPPAEIQRLRDRTRLRKALAGERTGWAHDPSGALDSPGHHASRAPSRQSGSGSTGSRLARESEREAGRSPRSDDRRSRGDRLRRANPHARAGCDSR